MLASKKKWNMRVQGVGEARQHAVPINLNSCLVTVRFFIKTWKCGIVHRLISVLDVRDSRTQLPLDVISPYCGLQTLLLLILIEGTDYFHHFNAFCSDIRLNFVRVLRTSMTTIRHRQVLKRRAKALALRIKFFVPLPGMHA